MSEIKRYELEFDSDNHDMPIIHENKNGTLVMYADHAAALRQARIDMVEKAIVFVCSWCTSKDRDESCNDKKIMDVCAIVKSIRAAAREICVARDAQQEK